MKLHDTVLILLLVYSRGVQWICLFKITVWVDAKDIRNFISDDTFLVGDRNEIGYFIYFDIKNQIF